MSVSHEEVVKAAQAEQILNSDVFKEAIENLKNEYITHWLTHVISQMLMLEKISTDHYYYYQKLKDICVSLQKKES